jgi:hypothetical protein
MENLKHIRRLKSNLQFMAIFFLEKGIDLFFFRCVGSRLRGNDDFLQNYRFLIEIGGFSF